MPNEISSVTTASSNTVSAPSPSKRQNSNNGLHSADREQAAQKVQAAQGEERHATVRVRAARNEREQASQKIRAAEAQQQLAAQKVRAARDEEQRAIETEQQQRRGEIIDTMI